LADAARSARERQKSSNPKHVLTDDDIASGRAQQDSAAAAGNEAQARALMEKSYPANPTVADLKSQIDQMSIYSKYPAADLTAKFKLAALYGYEKVDFPGKQEWEAELETATNHFLNEASGAASRLQAILDQNQDALSRHDPESSRRVRALWMEAVVSYASWQMRLQQLITDGQSRAKAYVSSSSTAASDYRRGRAKQSESAVAWTMIRFREMEDEFKKHTGHYACNLADFNFNANNPNKPYNAQYFWENKLANIRSLGYDIVMQGCDATHFTALAVPPALDGNQGRAFCTNQSDGTRIADDGSSVHCLSNGAAWHGQ
jgi:hypothetical protein